MFRYEGQTLESCTAICEGRHETDGCNFFAFADEGEYAGVCIGCDHSGVVSHTKFDFYMVHMPCQSPPALSPLSLSPPALGPTPSLPRPPSPSPTQSSHFPLPHPTHQPHPTSEPQPSGASPPISTARPPPPPQACHFDGYMTFTQTAAVGDTEIFTGAHDCRLKVGDYIILGGTGNTEVVEVTGFGSILIKPPLRYVHAAGEMIHPYVGVLPPPAPRAFLPPPAPGAFLPPPAPRASPLNPAAPSLQHVGTDPVAAAAEAAAEAATEEGLSPVAVEAASNAARAAANTTSAAAHAAGAAAQNARDEGLSPEAAAAAGEAAGAAAASGASAQESAAAGEAAAAEVVPSAVLGAADRRARIALKYVHV